MKTKVGTIGVEATMTVNTGDKELFCTNTIIGRTCTLAFVIPLLPLPHPTRNNKKTLTLEVNFLLPQGSFSVESHSQ